MSHPTSFPQSTDQHWHVWYIVAFSFLSFFIHLDVKGQKAIEYYLGKQLYPDTTATFPFPEDEHEHDNSMLLPNTLVSSCNNSNFNLGNFNNWTGCYGNFANSCATAGFLTTGAHPVHRINQGPGWYDNNTCEGLKTVYNGEAFSARFGDTIYTNSAVQRAGEMKYAVTVTEDQYLFVYRYAVVLQTGGHATNQQPDFKIAITNAAGTTLDPTCGYYYITAPTSGPPPEGWNRCQNNSHGDIYWKDWTTVGMDLTPYLGQTVYVNFKVRGCTYNTHFGYAYISAYCSALQIQTGLCNGDTVAVLTAPPGFTYLWSNGSTAQSITIQNPVTGSIYTCQLTAPNGCQVTISQTLIYTLITADFSWGTSCAGRNTQFNDLSTVSQNSVVNWKWDFGDGGTAMGTATPVHVFANPGSYDVRLISFSTEGCQDTIVKTVHVDSLPVATGTPASSGLCSKSTTNIGITSNLLNTTFTWTANSINGTTSGMANGSGTSIVQTLTNNAKAIDTVNYLVTPLAGNCTGDVTKIRVGVYPTPRPVLTSKIKSICDSTLTNLGVTPYSDSTKFTWRAFATSPFVSGFTNNTSSPDTIINQRLRNTGNTIDTVYYRLVGHAFGCVGDSFTYKVAVFPVPRLTNSPPLSSICSGTSPNVTLTSNVTGTTFTWTVANSSGNLTGSSNNAIGTTILNQTLTNSGTATENAIYTTRPKANNCYGWYWPYTVNVYPVPNLTNSPTSKTICSGENTNVVLTSSVTGTQFTWTCTPSSGNVAGFVDQVVPTTNLSQVLTNSGSTSETVTYNITPVANNCLGSSYNYVVTVNPTPVLTTNLSPQQICSGSATSIALSANVLGTTFTWSAQLISGTITGFSNGTGPSIAQTLTNNLTTTGVVRYIITPTASSCVGLDTSIYITVKPLPHMSNIPASKQLCSNTSTDIVLTSDVTGGLFTWTATGSSPQVSGYSDVVSPTTLLEQILTNSGSNIETVTYHVVGHANGCDGPSSDFVVTVYPVPNVAFTPPIPSLCSTQTTNIALNSTVTGTTFSWTATASSPTVVGFSGGSGNLIAQTLVTPGIVAETVTYSVTPLANSCSGSTSDVTVTINPKPHLVNHPMHDTICSGQTTSILLQSSCLNTSFTWSGAINTGTITGFGSGTGSLIAQTLFNSQNTLGSVVYTIHPTAGSCLGTDTTYIVWVKPNPLLTNSPASNSICSNTSTNVALTSNVAGTTFTWTASGSSLLISGYSNSVAPGISINQVLTNSGFSDETVTYHLTPSANGCPGTDANYIVTVHPVPDLSNNPATKAICSGQSTGVTLTSNIAGTNFTWIASGSSPQVSGFSNNAVPTTSLNQVLFNSGYVDEIVTYTLTPIANGCAGNAATYTVTVHPVPNLSNLPASQNQCNNQATNITLTSSVTGTNFTWTASSSSLLVTGYSNSVAPGTAINQTLVNPGYTVETVTYTITPHANGCDGLATPYVVTVYPTPDLSNNPASQTQCNSTATNINLTSHVSGTSFSWTASGSSLLVSGYSNSIAPGTLINQTLVNAGYAIESVTYSITPQAHGCNGSATPYTVTINPSPDLSNNPASQSQCNNLATGLNLTSHVAGTQFTWTASGSSLLVSGYSNSVAPGTSINQTLINTGSNNESVTYTLTPSANGCTGSTFPYTVTVYPTATVTTNPMSQTICTNTSILVNLTSAVSGTTFAWTCTPSSGNLGGFASGNTNQIDQTLTNSGFTIETVTYNITPTANGCIGTLAPYVATVNPKPDLSNTPASSQICSGNSPMVTLTSHVATTNFTWTATGSSPMITGFSNNSTPTTLLNQTLTNSGFNVETVTYRMTPIAHGCVGDVTDYIVSIVSVPDVYFNPSSQTICSNQTSNVQLLSHVVGTTYTWTASASSANVSGYSNGTGPLIAQQLFNAGTTSESVTYTATPAAFGCPTGPTQTVIVTVNPRPKVVNPLRSYAICSATTTNIPLQADVPGSTYAWSASGSSLLVTGYSPGSGSFIQQTLSNTGFTNEIVTYVVTPTANSCSGDTSHFQVVVFPVADAYYTPPTQAICPLQTTNVTISSHVAGASFSWTASGSSLLVSGYSAGTGNLVQQTLNNTGYSIETVTYHVTPVANACTGTASNLVISVNPNPSVSFNTCWDEVTTTDAQPIKLKGVAPVGGTFSGTGVVGSTFYPAIAGVGSFPILYNFSNSYGCSGSGTQTITVVAPLAFACSSTLTDPRDTKTYPTVQIGTQCWMAANLNYGTTVNASLMQRDNCTSEKYCYNDNGSNCATFGGLYQWDELMKYENASGGQGLCPPGWHVPTEADWNTLFTYYISSGFAGSALKPSGYSGFNAYLDGARFKNVNWNFLDFATLLWSSTSRGTYKAWAHGMNDYNPSVSSYPAARSNAFSVRCLKD